jgi:hypothetical protein
MEYLTRFEEHYTILLRRRPLKVFERARDKKFSSRRE